jgi:hypothetical protein
MNKNLKYHGMIYNSKIDLNGNTYWALVITRLSDGKEAFGHIAGGESNCTWALKQMANDDWNQFFYNRSELSIREFNRLTKNWQYFGCTPDQIISEANNQFNVGENQEGLWS